MNITIDNYEAFLLDYMEGNLSTEGAAELKQFVTTQGLDWDELTTPLPHLEAPQIAYKDKENLKKKTAVVPLYVKIASAAAAAGLLLTVALWPDNQLPKVEPIAELKPILPKRLIITNEITPLPPRTIQFVQSQTIKKTEPIVQERVEIPLIAKLEPQKPQVLPSLADSDEPDFGFLVQRMNTSFVPVQFAENDSDQYLDDERELSFIGKGIYRLTNGRHDSFASIISSGLSTAKKEVSLAATDFALTAYYRADERFEEAKERWEEKLGE